MTTVNVDTSWDNLRSYSSHLHTCLGVYKLAFLRSLFIHKKNLSNFVKNVSVRTDIVRANRRRPFTPAQPNIFQILFSELLKFLLQMRFVHAWGHRRHQIAETRWKNCPEKVWWAIIQIKAYFFRQLYDVPLKFGIKLLQRSSRQQKPVAAENTEAEKSSRTVFINSNCRFALLMHINNLAFIYGLRHTKWEFGLAFVLFNFGS